METIEAPGLKWRERKDRWVPVWVPRSDAVKNGYPSGTVNLEYLLSGPCRGKQLDPRNVEHLAIGDRCKALQAEMLLWLAGMRRGKGGGHYDGSIGSVLKLYETHPESTFQALKPGSLAPYISYLKRLHGHVGGRRVAAVTAYDVKQWYKVWSDADPLGRPRKLAAGATTFAVLKAAVKWGAICGVRDCRTFYADLKLLKFPKRKPRKSVATAGDVIKARDAAHAAGAPSRALAYALQFETALRQWDVKGQWYPMDYPILSDVHGPDGKWAGLMWRHVDDALILRYTPSKTELTSEAEVIIDLKLCPMVLEEIARVPPDAMHGPIIVNERTGIPYTKTDFQDGWRQDFKAAGLPATLWGRDLRASAVTEGRGGGAAIDDAAKVAGHTKPRTTADVYDRECLEAQRRFQVARLKKRNDTGTGSGE